MGASSSEKNAGECGGGGGSHGPDDMGGNDGSGGKAQPAASSIACCSSISIFPRKRSRPNSTSRRTLSINGSGSPCRRSASSAAPMPRASSPATSEPYQRLIHQSPHIEDPPSPEQSSRAVSHQIRHADRAGETGGPDLKTEQRPATWSSLPLPFATRSHPRNEMSVGLRLLWIFLIATGAAFSAGMYLAGLESLARLLKG